MARQFPSQLLFFTHIIGTIGRVNRLRPTLTQNMSRRMAYSRGKHHSLDVLIRFAKRTKSRASQNKLGRPNSAGEFVEPATSRSPAPDRKIAWQILLAAPRLRAKSFQLGTPRYWQTTNVERTNLVAPPGLAG
jgi:hypothetical protein